MLQVESIKGVENIEELLAFDEVDGVMIGPLDIAGSLGVPGQMQHPQVVAATDRFLAACQVHQKTPAVLVMSVAEGQAQMQRGFTMIAYSGDLWLYQAALRRGLAELQSAHKR